QLGRGSSPMKSTVRATLHLISYNLLVFFVLANILYWSIPVINSISAVIRGEQGAAGAEYRSFIGWRTLPIGRAEVHARGEPYTQRQTINGRRTREGKAYFLADRQCGDSEHRTPRQSHRCLLQPQGCIRKITRTSGIRRIKIWSCSCSCCRQIIDPLSSYSTMVSMKSPLNASAD